MTTLALYSNKGGVGKTAAAVNLAYLAAQAGVVTLLCDLDAQGSSTFYFRVKPGIKRKARGLAKGKKQINESVRSTDYELLDLLPADLSHRNLDVAFDKLKHPKERLRKVLEPLQEIYDLIVLDCPPTINLLAENVFTAADIVLAPVIPTTLSLRAHEQLVAFFDANGYDKRQLYAFFSMVDGRKKMHRALIDQARREFGNVLHSAIPNLSHVEQMGVHRAPVPVFAPSSPAAAAYAALWAEVRSH
jgi:cellulose biosynthesis protein BcsQ